MKNLINLTIVILSLFSFIQGQILSDIEKVRKIKIFESSRENARDILTGLERAPEVTPYQDIFYTKNSSIIINYSEGQCKESEKSESWDVPESKVIYISIYLKNFIRLNAVNFNLSKYKKENRYTNYSTPKIYHNKDLGTAIETINDKVREIIFAPQKKHYSLLCDAEKAKRLALTKSWFDPLIKKRIYQAPDNFANVIDLTLSLSELSVACVSFNSPKNKSCSADSKAIDVFTEAQDPEGDVLIYDYKISGGKIIGQGAKVVWDLSDVKPGKYTITAAVDDGCGFCGTPKTREVVVKECSDCKKDEK